MSNRRIYTLLEKHNTDSNTHQRKLNFPTAWTQAWDVYLHKRDILNLSSTKEDGYLFYWCLTKHLSHPDVCHAMPYHIWERKQAPQLRKKHQSIRRKTKREREEHGEREKRGERTNIENLLVHSSLILTKLYKYTTCLP